MDRKTKEQENLEKMQSTTFPTCDLKGTPMRSNERRSHERRRSSGETSTSSTDSIYMRGRAFCKFQLAVGAIFGLLTIAGIAFWSVNSSKTQASASTSDAIKVEKNDAHEEWSDSTDFVTQAVLKKAGLSKINAGHTAGKNDYRNFDSCYPYGDKCDFSENRFTGKDAFAGVSGTQSGKRIAGYQRLPEAEKTKLRMEPKKIPRHFHQVLFNLRKPGDEVPGAGARVLAKEEFTEMNTYSQRMQVPKVLSAIMMDTVATQHRYGPTAEWNHTLYNYDDIILWIRNNRDWLNDKLFGDSKIHLSPAREAARDHFKALYDRTSLSSPVDGSVRTKLAPELLGKWGELDIVRVFDMIAGGNPAAVTDFFRYLVIYREGGWYLDNKTGIDYDLGVITRADQEMVVSFTDVNQGRNDYLDQWWETVGSKKFPANKKEEAIKKQAKIDKSYNWYQRRSQLQKELAPFQVYGEALNTGFEIVQFFFGARAEHPILRRVIHNLMSQAMKYETKCAFKWHLGPGEQGPEESKVKSGLLAQKKALPENTMLWGYPQNMTTEDAEKKNYHDRRDHTYCTAYYGTHDLTGPNMWTDNILAGAEEFMRSYAEEAQKPITPALDSAGAALTETMKVVAPAAKKTGGKKTPAKKAPVAKQAPVAKNKAPVAKTAGKRKVPSDIEAQNHVLIVDSMMDLGVSYMNTPKSTVWDVFHREDLTNEKEIALRQVYVAGTSYYAKRIPLVYPWRFAKNGVAGKINMYRLDYDTASQQSGVISLKDGPTVLA